MRGDSYIPIIRAYVQSFFSLVQNKGKVEQVEDELFHFKKLLQQQLKLWGFLNNPRIRSFTKKEALRKLLGKKISSLTLDQLCFLIDQHRERYITKFVDEFLVLSSEVSNYVIAEAVTAVPMSREQSLRLKEELSHLVGKEVCLKEVVDKAVLGGVLIRMDEKIIDASVRHQLEDLRYRLATR